MKLIKKLFKGLFLVLLGGLGGMLWQLIGLPYLAQMPATKDLWFVRNWRERRVILYPKQEKIIRENRAVTEAVKRVEQSVLTVKSTDYAGTTTGSALVLTSDGRAVTLAELLPRKGSFSVYAEGEELEAKVVKRDLEKNLALLNLEKEGLSAVAFARPEEVEKGERVFLVRSQQGEKGKTAVEVGVVTKKSDSFLYPAVQGKGGRGSPLFNVKGEVLGINKRGLDGGMLTIPISEIKTFADL